MKLPDRGRKTNYFKNILIGFDQFIGTIFGIDADETISSYIGTHHSGSKKEKFINWIFNDKYHCVNSIEIHKECGN